MAQIKNPTVVRDKCGTYAGWNAHVKNIERPCDDCRDANAEHVRVWRIKRSESNAVSIPIATLQQAFRAPDGMAVIASWMGDAVSRAVIEWSPFNRAEEKKES